MFINENFSFNDISSQDMGVMLIHESNESSLVQKFTPDKAVFKDRPRFKDSKSFYYGSDKQILTLTIKITKIDGTAFDYSDRTRLMQWLCPSDNQFHPLISEDYPEIVFWVQFIKTQFANYFSNQGFITLEAESYLPYPTSPVLYSEYDLTQNASSTIIEVDNNSNVVSLYLPILEFTLQDTTTSFKIINHSNGGQIFEFDNLTVGETININNDTMQIISSNGIQRISNFNFGFLKLVYGVNQLEVFGKCKLSFKMIFPMQI